MQFKGTGLLGTHQSKSYTGTAGTIDDVIGDGVLIVRVVVTTDAFIKIGKAVTATANDVPLFANQPEYFSCSAGMVVSAIQSSSGGTLHVTEIN